MKYSFIPQMSPMYWILLLIFTIIIMYMYISMLYFNSTLNYSMKLNKKYKNIYYKIKI